MVKLRITRNDQVVIEAEGTADDLAKLIGLILPWQVAPITVPTVWGVPGLPEGDSTIKFTQLPVPGAGG